MSTESRRLKLAFYGDDFTGSTDALEVLAFAATTHDAKPGRPLQPGSAVWRTPSSRDFR